MAHEEKAEQHKLVIIFASDSGLEIVGPFDRWDETIDYLRGDYRQNMRLPIVSPSEYLDKLREGHEAAREANDSSKGLNDDD